MHRPVSHPLTDPAHAELRRLEAIDAILEEAQRATVEANQELARALSQWFGHARGCLTEKGARRTMGREAAEIHRASEALAGTTASLAREAAAPMRTRGDS